MLLEWKGVEHSKASLKSILLRQAGNGCICQTREVHLVRIIEPRPAHEISTRKPETLLRQFENRGPTMAIL
ncbi:MAG TPA: hypothetical protein DIT13_05335, partial [Verrucomicrobiales bacterium]|nr:hypothetical protein [Verrucomicrobiales bacterium]